MFDTHAVTCPQVWVKGRKTVRCHLAQELSRLRDGVLVDGVRHDFTVGFYGDYHAIEASIIPPDGARISAKVNYPGCPSELKRIRKDPANCMWVTHTPCWYCQLPAYKLYATVRDAEILHPHDGLRSVFGTS